MQKSDYCVGVCPTRPWRLGIARMVKILLRDQCTLDDQMQESWSAGLTELLVDAAGDASQHSFPWHGMFLTAMLPKEIQRGGISLIRQRRGADERELNFDNAEKRLSQSLKSQSCRAIITESRGKMQDCVTFSMWRTSLALPLSVYSFNVMATRSPPLRLRRRSVLSGGKSSRAMIVGSLPNRPHRLPERFKQNEISESRRPM